MIRSTRALTLCLAALAAGTTSCASQDALLQPPEPPPAAAAERGRGLIRVGEFFSTEFGDLVVLRVQDEYRLVRHVAEGPIEGYYDVIFAIPEREIVWNTWRTVAPGAQIDLAFISPMHVAVRPSATALAAR